MKIKHMAAAVLYAVLSLGGSSELMGSSAAIDSDEDASAGCLEFAPDLKHSGSSLVLSVASRLCGEAIDGAWVMHSHHRAAAAAAVHHDANHVAVVDMMIDPPLGYSPEMGSELLARALTHCRELDALKVIIEPAGMDPVMVRTVAASRGYQFSRTVNLDPVAGGAELEFYTDLYWIGQTSTSD